MTTMKELKSYLKVMALEIRSEKDKRKTVPHGYVPGLYTLRNEYRHHHIAYCLLRGTPAEKIEHNTDYIESVWTYFVKPIMDTISLEKREVVNEA